MCAKSVMVQKQWRKLKMKFLLADNIKTIIK